MKERCENPRSKYYKNYGGRGIRICTRWKDSLVNFWADMGPTWEKGLSIDRIDNEGPYSPDNCRWATAKEQARNRRNNVWVETSAGSMLLVEAARIYGLSSGTIHGRIMRGWPSDKLLEPVKS